MSFKKRDTIVLLHCTNSLSVLFKKIYIISKTSCSWSAFQQTLLWWISNLISPDFTCFSGTKHNNCKTFNMLFPDFTPVTYFCLQFLGRWILRIKKQRKKTRQHIFNCTIRDFWCLKAFQIKRQMASSWVSVSYRSLFCVFFWCNSW